jgi:VWFA-related protein
LLGTPETARYTIIAIDRINTAPQDLIRVREGLTKFLAETSDPGEPVGLISIDTNGILLIQDFTTDPSLIGAALKRATSGSGAKPEQSSTPLDEYTREVEAALGNPDAADTPSTAGLKRLFEGLTNAKNNENRRLAFQERSARISSLEALRQIALSVSGLPGRKSLVWTSSGFPFASIVREGYPSYSTIRQSQRSLTYDFSQVNEALSLDAYTTHLLSTANIAMYPVDARGLTNTAWDSVDPSHKYSPTATEKAARQQANQDVITTFEHLAAGTGGKPCYNRPDLADCLKEALNDSRDYYLIGFYVDKGTKEGWHKLQVKVDGANTRSRTGFLFPLPDPEKTRDLDMGTAAQSLLMDPGIPFKGEWTSTERKGDKIANAFVLHVAPGADVVDTEQRKMNLEFVGIARNKEGVIAGRFEQRVAKDLTQEAVEMIRAEGLTYKHTVELPGEYLVRFVVRDNLTGRTGAVNSLLKVE